MKKPYLFLMLVLFLLDAVAQAPDPVANGGEFRFESTSCITPQQSESIKSLIRQQQVLLRQRGILPAENAASQRVQATSFAWPLQQAAGITDPGYYGISNYVDQNLAYPNLLRDYNCGNRTYDLSGGYNHAGTDIFTWPYGQLKQQNDEVEIVAAAPGIIVYKNDGSPDHSCAFCTSSCLWNAVYLQHADGSVTWYGHMKNGSVTTKAVGATVAQGEKMGIVGSSGNSTGPHLHFEVYADAAMRQLVDPWQGTCNPTSGPLYNAGLKWADQKPYRESMLNRIQVGKRAASWGDCPALELPNTANYFSPKDTIYMTTFYHDQVNGNVSSLSLIQPNGVAWSQWSHTSPSTYNASYWFWRNVLPADAMYGTWTFRVQYLSQVVTIPFTVGAPLPITLKNFTASATGACKALVEWQTASETNNRGFHLQRSTDGTSFEEIGWVAGAGSTTTPRSYAFTDDKASTSSRCQQAFYRLAQEDVDGKMSISQTALVRWAGAGKAVIVFPNPAKDKITIQGDGLKQAVLLDATGRALAQIALQPYATTYSVAALQPGKYTLQLLYADGSKTTAHFLKN